MKTDTKYIVVPSKIRMEYPPASESITRAVFETEIYDLPFAPDGPTVSGVLDIGAHFGAVSLLALARGYRVVAVEPLQEMLPILYRNLTGLAPLLHFAAIVPARYGIDHDGMVPFWYNEKHPAGSKLACVPPREPSYSVRGVSLPYALRNWTGGWDRVVLKLDCEGAEAALFDCSDEDFERVVGVLMEWHGVDDEVEYTDWLESHGFSITKKGRNWSAWR